MYWRLSSWLRPYSRPGELAAPPSWAENNTHETPASAPKAGAMGPAAKTTRPKKVMRNVEIAIAGEGRDGVGSESGNVRRVHGCLPKRSSFGGLLWKPTCAPPVASHKPYLTSHPPRISQNKAQPPSGQAVDGFSTIIPVLACFFTLERCTTAADYFLHTSLLRIADDTRIFWPPTTLTTTILYPRSLHK
jgi:hypothetical protein